MSSLEWMDQALCAQADPTLFISDQKGAHPSAGKRICAECPVKAECLNYALRNHIDDGIYGGTTPDERRVFRGVKPRHQAQCGQCGALVNRGTLRTHRIAEHEEIAS